MIFKYSTNKLEHRQTEHTSKQNRANVMNVVLRADCNKLPRKSDYRRFQLLPPSGVSLYCFIYQIPRHSEVHEPINITFTSEMPTVQGIR